MPIADREQIAALRARRRQALEQGPHRGTVTMRMLPVLEAFEDAIRAEIERGTPFDEVTEEGVIKILAAMIVVHTVNMSGMTPTVFASLLASGALEIARGILEDKSLEDGFTAITMHPGMLS